MGKLHTRRQIDGSAAYSYRYYYLGQNRRISLGRMPKQSARILEAEFEAHLRRGEDPREYFDEMVRTNQERVIRERDAHLSTLIDKYIISSEEKGNAQSTIQRKEQQLEDFHIHVGDIDVQEIDAELIEEYVRSIGNGKSQATKHGYMRELRAFFCWCERRGYVEVSPHRRMNPIKAPVLTPKSAFTPKQIEQLLHEMDPESAVYRATRIALFTAMRLNEVVNLQWEHVDFEHRLLHLPHTKAKKYQTIPMSDELFSLLVVWKAEGSSKPVGYAHKSNVSQEFSKIRDKLGFDKQLTFHALRRTVATLLLANGESTFYVSRLLRHSSFAVTEASYAHVLNDRLSETANRLPAILQGKSDNVNQGVASN